MLGGAVDRPTLVVLHPRNRARGDDRATAARNHARQHGLNGAKGSDGVDLHHLGPVGRVCRGDRVLAQRQPSVGHTDVDRLGLERLDHVFARAVADDDLHGHRQLTALDLGANLLQPVRTSRHQHE
eukprot:2913660-Prymnesium_polylepis.1